MTVLAWLEGAQGAAPAVTRPRQQEPLPAAPGLASHA